MNNFDEYIKSILHTKIDFDNAFGVQCVDLFNHYVYYFLSKKIQFYPRYAKQFWTERNDNEWLKSCFEFISIDEIKKGNIKKGDIGVRTSGTAGHIFLIGGVQNNHIIQYDQNHTGKHEPVGRYLLPIGSDYISGILRPKKDIICTCNRYSLYTLTQDVNVWVDCKFSDRVKRENASEYAKAHSCDSYFLILKKNTKFECLETYFDNKFNLWVRTWSGWLCATYNGNKRVRWCNNE